jgi:hypothetical protein
MVAPAPLRLRCTPVGQGALNCMVPDSRINGACTDLGSKRSGSVGDARSVLERISKTPNLDDYCQEHWSSSFDQYLDVAWVTGTPNERLSDMIPSYGIKPVRDTSRVRSLSLLRRSRKQSGRCTFRPAAPLDGDRQRHQGRGAQVRQREPELLLHLMVHRKCGGYVEADL